MCYVGSKDDIESIALIVFTPYGRFVQKSASFYILKEKYMCVKFNPFRTLESWKFNAVDGVMYFSLFVRIFCALFSQMK